MRVLGVDYGTRKVGLALADTQAKTAVPLDVWYHDNEPGKMAERIAGFVRAEQFDRIVVGVPRKADGSASAQTDIALDFLRKLSSSTAVLVEEIEESFTTTESRRLQREHGSRVKEDALAAMLLLQDYLEKTRG
ncbi:Holliday junction resolvase RuvX [Candidatus Uhrbacteria bacterium]|nr:Holliday junction resolvase RuvX [Candidatus Uhrbacteria bacterium]